MPALFFTLIATFVACFYILAPREFQKFSQSLIYSVFSLSNIFFWKESGYFDTDSQFKPLLHTWSLSVEEQFYFFWPFLLVFLFKYVKGGHVLYYIMMLALLSALSSIVMLKIDKMRLIT
jgi:peptidoglycan/LPS O-acetylase OafA/YrhL